MRADAEHLAPRFSPWRRVVAIARLALILTITLMVAVSLWLGRLALFASPRLKRRWRVLHFNAWSRAISTYTGLVAASRNIYLTDDDSNVIALDQKSGSVIWRYEKLRGRKLNAPAVTRDHVVVGDHSFSWVRCRNDCRHRSRGRRLLDNGNVAFFGPARQSLQ